MSAARRDLAGAVALVTGASSGVGRAIAIALAGAGTRNVLVGRRRDALEETAREAGADAVTEAVDLEDDEALLALARRTLEREGRLDVLVHSAAYIALGEVAHAPVAELDRHLRVNVRAPYLLTQALLPALVEARGQVVMVNSTAGHTAPANAGQYAASKHALRALADALREEVAERVRVISVYPSKIATPMQERLHEAEGWTYRPERLTQPEDVAAAVLAALTVPETSEVTDVLLRTALRHRAD